MEAEALSPVLSVDRFTERLALVDRILLALFVYSMGIALYAIYLWGFDLAYMRLLFDAIGGSFLTAILVYPVLLVMVAANWHRRVAGAGMVCASYVLGFGLWCFATFMAWVFAGTVATLAGVAALGIGVVPVAMVGALLRGEWLMPLLLVAISALVVTSRRFGAKWAQ